MFALLIYILMNWYLIKNTVFGLISTERLLPRFTEIVLIFFFFFGPSVDAKSANFYSNSVDKFMQTARRFSVTF